MTFVARPIKRSLAESNRLGMNSPEIVDSPQPSAPVVFIRDLVVETTIGVHPHERTQPKSLRLDIEIELAGSRAGESDRLVDTIDYAAVIDAIRSRLSTMQYHLLECLAEVVAAMILDEFGGRWVSVQIAKTGIFPDVGPVGVRIERWGCVAPHQAST